MPIARFQMPDGKIGRFEVPEGTTPEAAQMQIEQMVSGGGADYAPNQPSPQPQSDLWSKVERQESGGNQSAVSPKGAVGVAQVMPGTAPEAAALAGLPFDETKYRGDADYNRKLGQAYLNKQMSEFGDEKLALAAYNAGPGRVAETIAKVGDPRNGQVSWDKFMSAMPEETRNYVRKISGPWSVQEGMIQDAKEGGRIAASGIKQGLGTLPEMLSKGLSSASQWGSVAADELGIPSIPGLRNLPAPTDLLKEGTDFLFKPRDYEVPQTELGKGASRVLGSTIAGAVSPGSLVPNLAAGFGAGVGAEIGSDLAGPGGSIAGGLIGSVVPAIATKGSSLVGTPIKTKEKLAGMALDNVNDYQLAIAKERMKVAQANGVDLTLEQAMPGETNIRKLQDQLTQMKAGEGLANQIRKQPEQIQASTENVMGRLPGQVLDQQQVSNNAQKSATEAYNAMKKARTNKVRPYYASAGNFNTGSVVNSSQDLKQLSQSYPNVDAGKLLQDLSDRMFTKEVKTINGQEVTVLKPITNVNKLNRVLRQASSDLKQPGLNGKAYDTETASIVNDAIKSVREDLGRANPAFAEANAKYADLSGPINTAKQGPLGTVAGKLGYDPSTPAARSTLFGLFDKGEPAGSSKILTLQKDMSKAKGGNATFMDSAKSWLADKIDKSLKFEGGELHPDTAANLEKNLFGTQNQVNRTKNLLAGMAKANGVRPDVYVKGLEGWAQTIKLASKRPVSTSGQSGKEIQEGAKTLFGKLANISVITPFRNTGRKIDEYVNQDAYRYISKLMQTPEGIDTLKILAAAKPGSKISQNALAKFNATLSAEQAAEDQAQGE